MTANEFREKEIWNDGYATGYASGRRETIDQLSRWIDQDELARMLAEDDDDDE
jgi:hypothetical protein